VTLTMVWPAACARNTAFLPLFQPTYVCTAMLFRIMMTQVLPLSTGFPLVATANGRRRVLSQFSLVFIVLSASTSFFRSASAGCFVCCARWLIVPPCATIPGGPTLEDLHLDDTLDDLHRIVRYSNSRIALQRLVHVKMLSCVAEEFPLAAVSELVLPLLDDLTLDNEAMIRQTLAEQLRGVAKAFVSSGAEEAYRLVTNQLLSHVRALVADPEPSVRGSILYSCIRSCVHTGAFMDRERSVRGGRVVATCEPVEGTVACFVGVHLPSSSLGCAHRAHSAVSHTLSCMLYPCMCTRMCVCCCSRGSVHSLVSANLPTILNRQVRIAAGETLVAIAGVLRAEDVGPRVLTIVLQLAHNDESEDIRMTAVCVARTSLPMCSSAGGLFALLAPVVHLGAACIVCTPW
jgi:hypothetical protein